MAHFGSAGCHGGNSGGEGISDIGSGVVGGGNRGSACMADILAVGSRNREEVVMATKKVAGGAAVECSLWC